MASLRAPVSKFGQRAAGGELIVIRKAALGREVTDEGVDLLLHFASLSAGFGEFTQIRGGAEWHCSADHWTMVGRMSD